MGAKNEILKLEDFDYTTVGNFGGISLTGRNNLNYAQKKTKNKHRVKVRTLNEFRDIERCNFLKNRCGVNGIKRFKRSKRIY